jgi:ABC-type Zn uptake system ZnuABC Zn-binding protein ZnuA
MPKLRVVSTSNIVGDWVKRVGGERVSSFSLLPPDADPHTFQPGARDVANVADADVVFTVGLSLEANWLEELVENAARGHESIISLGELVDPVEFVEIFDEHGAHEDEHDDHGHDEHEDEHDEHVTVTGRLLVANADESYLAVVNLMDGGVADHAFEVAAGGARVYSSPHHRFGFALARGDGDDDDRVHIFDSGVYLVEHGDHHDLVSKPISMLELGISDERPIHFANAGEWTAIFHDGTGRVALLNEHEMEESGDGYEITFLNTGLQHGAAVPMEGDLFAVSVANPDYPDRTESSLPIGVEVRDLHDHVVYDGSSNDCPGLHGEAHNHDGVAFGCVGGVLFIEKHDDHFDHWFIENPSKMRAESRIGTLYGHHEAHALFGKASYRGDSGFMDDGVWLIDPEESTMTLALAASDDKRSVGAAFGHEGKYFYALTYDGMLNVLDAHDGDVVSEVQLLESVDPEALPSFVIVGELLYLADPASEHVIEFSLEHMEIEREWEVHGAPNRLAFLGIVSGQEHPEEGHDEDEHGHEDEEGHDDDEMGHDHHGHAHGEFDPHFWFDPPRVQNAVNEIAVRLSELDPDGAEYYSSNAVVYISELSELHSWIQEQVEPIPESDRLIVTSHDSFQYFAALYGFKVVGAVLPSLSTEAEPTAQELAGLVETIEHEGAKVIFGENIHSDRLAKRIAEETGASVVGSLYTGSLGEPGGDAGTYLDLMRFNVNTIVEALK